MVKLYTLAKFETSIPKGLMVELIPMPNLFLWHRREDDESHLYSLMPDSGFLLTLSEAKERVLGSITSKFFSQKNSSEVAVIEVEEDDEAISQFNKIFIFENNQWLESEINKENLTSPAFDLINAMYKTKGLSLV